MKGFFVKASSKRLRTLVCDVRAAPTAADERRIVAEECAIIRDQCGQDDGRHRARNAAKLIYFYILGYPVQLIQVECLKLIVSERFLDKRIGYLCCSLFLDECSDVHLLLCNTLKSDIDSPNDCDVLLALSCLANVASPQMVGHFAHHINQLILSEHDQIRKKALVCCSSFIRKAPELADLFVPSLLRAVLERNTSVLYGVIVALKQAAYYSSGIAKRIRKFLPHLTSALKSLLGREPDCCESTYGINNPFLQVKLVELLRLVLAGCPQPSDKVNDVLTQVANQTDGSNNVGQSVLYETAVTIMEIECGVGLRVLAVNILGRFLTLHRSCHFADDRNVRYVALNALKKVIGRDVVAVQRHRQNILLCLKDPDCSVQRRAMDLCFALCSRQNINSTSEGFFELMCRCSDKALLTDCASIISVVVERFAPDVDWQLDACLRLLTTAGCHVREDVIASTVQLVSCAGQTYQLRCLLRILRLLDDHNQLSNQPLLQVACWVIGEYGDLICSSCDNSAWLQEKVVGFCRLILTSRLVLNSTKMFCLNCLVKLSCRFNCESSLRAIKELINLHGGSVDLELQQRSVEYSRMLKLESDSTERSLLSGLFERIPTLGAPDAADRSASSDDNSSAPLSNGSLEVLDDCQPAASELSSSIGNGHLLLDLTGDHSEVDGQQPSWTDVVGVLQDKANLVFLNDQIELHALRQSDSCSGEKVLFSVGSVRPDHVVTDLKLEFAVPKSARLNVSRPSGSVLSREPNASVVRQEIAVSTGNVPIKLRISYVVDGEQLSFLHLLPKAA